MYKSTQSRPQQPATLRFALWGLALATLVLAMSGLVMLYGSTPARWADGVFVRQFIALSIGIIGAAIVVKLPYEWLKGLGWPAYLLAVVLLGFVLVISRPINGAHRWIEFAGTRFQPSDFAKLALILALAHYCANCGSAIRSFRRGIVLPGVIVGAICGLIFVEPDWGTAMILGLTCAIMLLVGGIKLWHAAIPGGIVVVLIGVALSLNGLRAERIYSWLHLYETRENVGYQAYQARIALAAGGRTGVGYGRSSQKHFVPESRTDFIYAIIGEETGFAGTMVLMGLFGLVLWSGVTIAAHAPDRFGTLTATGISFLLAGQALCNLAVVSGALPNKGLTLPFISQGGSNLMMMLISVGVLLRIARSAEEPSSPKQQALNLFDEPMPEFS